MKKVGMLWLMALVLLLTACGGSEKGTDASKEDAVVNISLSNSEILVDGEAIGEDENAAVYRANDIIFYLEGQGIAYGEGSKEDEHSQKEADAHTVIHITKPGTYALQGSLDAGQIFVDLGEDAEDDPKAVVNLLLNGVDISCTVAPAVLFYQVYECETNTDEEDAVMEVDTTKAGANVTIGDGTVNNISGSYVAKIYESCELSEDGKSVIDSKKLHKYDAAFYSKMSMNIYGDTGILKIDAANEGLDTEMHLKIHGGNVEIESGNDGINVNEDNVSVFEMNGGSLRIQVTGETGEGDGIDSNGWLIINGGSVTTASCATSMDAGIDADQGIYINGGAVAAFGNMPAELAEGTQKSASFQSMERFQAGKTYEVRDSQDVAVMKVIPSNTTSMLVVSHGDINENDSYSLWLDDTKIADSGAEGGFGGPGMMKPGNGERPEGMPEGMPNGEWPEGMPEGMPNGKWPEGMPEGMPNGEWPGGERPEGMPRGERPKKM